jgi:protein O-mannosyl-transferase
MPTHNASTLSTFERSPLAGVLLLLAVLIAYLPAIGSGFIWDDTAYVQYNPLLASPNGLKAIWTDIHSTPQWYPMVFTTFWIEHQFWGVQPAGYHATNIVLHGVASVLLWRLLVRMKLRAAFPAALLWAIHPVNVESVAWITERKNTLSAVFYFAAFHCLWSARKRSTLRWTIGGFAVFVLALLSKTVTASLPAAFLVVCYWADSRLSLRWIFRLVPFFVVGATLGLLTAHLERSHVGAMGSEWDYHPTLAGEWLHRSLIAGQCVGFYLWSLVWPVNLMFIYPRFDISLLDGADYVVPSLLGLLTIFLLVFHRRREWARHGLAAWLLFVGTLLPAIGFLNVWPHRYSFVADHFQYLACVAPLVLLGWCVRRLPASLYPSVGGSIAIVLILLSMLQARKYADSITLWTDTVRRNPESWMAHVNLGHALIAEGRRDEAFASYERAYELHQNVDTKTNKASVLANRGEFATAVPMYEAIQRTRPGDLASGLGLANIYLLTNEPDRAEAMLNDIARHPQNQNDAELWRRLGEAAYRLGKTNDSIGLYRRSITLKPQDVTLQVELASVQVESPAAEHWADAEQGMTRALNTAPGDFRVWKLLGLARGKQGDEEGCRQALMQSLKLNPGQPEIRQLLSR